MKTLILICIVLIVIPLRMTGQWYDKYYPGRQLSDLNSSELLFLRNKSHNLKATGTGMIIGGSIVAGCSLGVIVISGFADMINLMNSGEPAVSSNVYAASLGFFIVGAAALATGVPLMITGQKRYKEVSRVSGPSPTEMKITYMLQPGLQVDRTSNKIVPGLTLSVRF